jgi:hypothetical protein
MAFDPVPWAISGSQLDAYVMRSLSNIATRDAQGIQLPGNAKVTATATPSGQINIAPGGLVIKNRQAAGQTYVGHIASDTLVPIAPTSGVARSDLIIATVRDPDFAPWQPYTDPNAILFGPYFYPEVISGVSGSTTTAASVVSYSAVELARIDIPANTTTITNAMITDLRTLHAPRYATAYDVQPVTSTQSILTTDTSFKDWPLNSLTVKVPFWATHCQAIITLNGIRTNNDSKANVRINFGGLTGPAAVFDFARPAWCNDFVSNTFQVFGEFDVRTFQNTNVIVKPQGSRGSPAGTGTINMDTRQQVAFDLQFSERVV